MMAKKTNLIALRLDDETLNALDALGDNRSETIRELIMDASAELMDVFGLDDDPRLNDGDIPRDIAREDDLIFESNLDDEIERLR